MGPPGPSSPGRLLDASELSTSVADFRLPPASLFDVLPDAVLRFDSAGRIVYANAAFERALMVGRRSLLGRTFGQVGGLSAYAALWEEQLLELLQTDEERWFKFRYEHPLGARHFDVRLFLERDGQAPHVTALLRDV